MIKLTDQKLEEIISSIEPFQIDHEGEEIVITYGTYESNQIKLNMPGYDIEATVVVTPVYVPTRIKAENEPTKELYENQITVLDAVIFFMDEMLLASKDQNKRLEAAIENKISVYPQP